MSLPAPPANGSEPAAFWLASEDKSPSAKLTHRASARSEYALGGPKRRVPACSGGSATTVSTRATPPSTRPGTEASTRASSRFTSTSRPRVPSLGPQCTTQWASEPEGFLTGAGPMDAATASPRAGPPELFQRGPTPQRNEHEGNQSSRKKNCWLGPEDSRCYQADRSALGSSTHEHRASQRSLRESASTSHPGLPPDLEVPTRHESLASLDDVLREMKALLRNVPEAGNDSLREERSRPAAAVPKVSTSHSKLSSRGSIGSARTSIGLRGHRAAAVGRGADTSTDDRSPSAHRAAPRRQPPQRTDRAENRASSRQRLASGVPA